MSDAPTTAELLRRYGLAPKKSWGQNFLIDRPALARLANACGLAPGETVVEIGAGLGALTEVLAGEGRRVLAVERDRDLVPILRERFADTPGVEIVEQNALNLDLAAIAQDAGGPIKLAGNLPYQISAPLLFLMLEQRAWLRSAHILVQREVAERISAAPGNKDYGLLSVLLGRVADISRDTEIKRTCFLPAPRVDSSFVSLFFKPADAAAGSVSDDFFTRFVKACFHQRRKTLANSLARQGFLPLAGELRERLRERHPELLAARAETLSVAQFEMLAGELAGWMGARAD